MASSFVRFVLASKHEPTPLGDVARDILLDPELERHWSYKRLIKYLEVRGVNSIVYDILAEANLIYINRHIVRRPPLDILI